jgi:NitT/TauT family transport system substrate-binding protein
MINDLVSVALYNKQEVQVQTVRYALTASSSAAMFSILSAKDSGVTSAAGLAGVPIGMSQGTVIDYVTTRLLEKEGLATEQIQSIAVFKLSERLTLLGSGELKAATLPEPFGSIAQKSGAVLIVSDAQYPEYGYSVLSFRKTFIDQNPRAVQGFLKAFEQAVNDINQKPEAWRSLLGEYKLVPQTLQATYVMPAFQPAAVPSEAQYNDVIDWMITRRLIESGGKYADSVIAKYLPK